MGSSLNLIKKIDIKNVYFNSNSYNDNELELIKLLDNEEINYNYVI